MQNHKNDTIKTSDTVFLEKYTSHFIWKGCVWEGAGDRTELQHIDPHSIGHNRVSFPFSWAAQPLWVLVFSIASYLQLVWSPTDWISCALSYIIVHRPPSFVGVTISHSFNLSTRSRLLYPNIPRPDAPVIYTGTFPILTARPDHWSIYNTSSTLTRSSST